MQELSGQTSQKPQNNVAHLPPFIIRKETPDERQERLNLTSGKRAEWHKEHLKSLYQPGLVVQTSKLLQTPSIILLNRTFQYMLLKTTLVGLPKEIQHHIWKLCLAHSIYKYLPRANETTQSETYLQVLKKINLLINTQED
jgi:hypothetical protein